jgi:negative regulator of flagellin synthesis FlgM
MKINDMQRIGAYRTYTQQTEHRVAGTSGKRSKDEVRFSSEARELLETQTRAASDPSRVQRIEQLKQEVSSGTYYVDTGKLAERIAPFLYPVYGKH